MALRFMAVLAGCAGTTLLAVALRHVLAPVNLVMLYLLAVVLLTMRYGRSAGVLASFVAVVAFDVFLVPPYNSLTVADTEYLLTFILMLVVSLIVSALTAGLRQQMLLAQARERRTLALFELSQELSGASMRDEIGCIGLRHLQALDAADTFLLFSDSRRILQPAAGTPAPGTNYLTTAQRIFDCLDGEGIGSPGVNVGNVLYIPLLAPSNVQGLLVLAFHAPRPTQEQERLLQTMTAQIALASERAQLIEQTQEQRLAVESERLRNSLLSAISHDVRTPLTAIASMANTLNESSTLPAPLRSDLLRSMQTNALRLRDMVQNILDMARLHAGRVQLRKEWQLIEEVIGSALSQLSNALAPIDVKVSIPADFPLLYFDAVLFERVLFNLLDNAIKYAGGEVAVCVSAVVEDQFAVITVEDNGPGFPAEKEQHIFLKFERGQQESPVSGTGLGLSICRAIIEAHDGQIRAENRPEGGARFIILMPLGSPPTTEKGKTMDTELVRILLIEDDGPIRHSVRVILQSDGVEVWEAATGNQGLSEIAARKPDLVLLDLGLPDIEGVAVINQLRQWSEIPIIVLSARSDEMQKVAALDAGADDYLTKPFGSAELRARIRAHLRKRQGLGSPLISFGDIALDLAQRTVRRRGLPVHLTPIEFKLLAALVRNAGKVLTHNQLLREAWGAGYGDRAHYLRIYMGHLRQKLEDEPARPRHITTETGVGYRLIL